MFGFCSLKGAQLGQCCTLHQHSGGHNPWLWMWGRDGTSCMQRVWDETLGSFSHVSRGAADKAKCHAGARSISGMGAANPSRFGICK